MDPATPFTLHTQKLGALPIINAFLARIGLARALEAYLPGEDPRLKLAPAEVIAVLVRNIVADHRPVYALGEWAAGSAPAALGLAPGQAELLGDDRVGRTLDRLFDADRASLITSVVLVLTVVRSADDGVIGFADGLGWNGPVRGWRAGPWSAW